MNMRDIFYYSSIETSYTLIILSIPKSRRKDDSHRILKNQLFSNFVEFLFINLENSLSNLSWHSVGQKR